MEGRESKRANDIFFACSLIDYFARKTLNKRAAVVDALGRDRIRKIIDLADVYHSDNIDAVSDEFIEEAGIATGDFDNVGTAKYAVPSHWDIGKVYKRLILQIAETENFDDVEALFPRLPFLRKRPHRQLQRQLLLRFPSRQLRRVRNGRSGVSRSGRPASSR